MSFRDRTDGGRHLGTRLKNRKLHNPLVLAIPRGGVVTGFALARELNAELDVVLSRKLRAPFNPEYALGAVSENGEVTLNPQAEGASGVTHEYLEAETRHQLAEIARRKKLFRAVRPLAPIAGRSVIVTDDGIATGSTMIAALQAVRAQRPHQLIMAVPVAPPDRLKQMRHLCDEVVCVLAPEDFSAVGQFYDEFDTVEDEEVVRLLSEAIPVLPNDPSREVVIPLGAVTLRGTLQWAGQPRGVVLFAHGSGSSRHSPRNRFVARTLVEAGFATLLLDLLTETEGEDREKVFDIALLADRLAGAAEWIAEQPETAGLPVGYFGASTGSAAALMAAAAHPDRVSAVVSRGGRPDLAWDDLPSVRAATLLIVGGDDEPVLSWNRDALDQLGCRKELIVVPGATHLFEEPGTLEQVAELARDWFERHLTAGKN
ncbi:MAG: phosphoribosyl transferase [Planctomycetaceae bacterium]|nr:phosphoribosyl transferase [Planctomycetaceae bacterium]